MKAEVKVTDVGPFRGTKRFVLDSSKINVIEAPNASGKSSIIKGIAALLSLPIRSSRENDMARRMGLVPDNPDSRSPLVNIESKEATVEFETDGKSRKLLVPSLGTPRVDPPGDFRFLYTGVLLRESEIVRKLDGGSDEFDWLVSSLSLSKGYEEVRAVVEEYSLKTRDLLEKLKAQQRGLKESEDELASLRSNREKVKKTRTELEVKLSKILAPDPKTTRQIEELTRDRTEKERTIESLQTQLIPATEEKSKAEAQAKRVAGLVSEYENEKKKIQAEIDGLPTKEKLLEAEKGARKIREDEIPEIKERIGGFGERAALLDQADKAIKQHTHSVPCPLCSAVGASPIGMIPTANLNKELQATREKLRDANSELARAIRKAGDLEAQRPEIERQKEELTKARRENEAASDKIKSQSLDASRLLDGKSRRLEAIRAELEEKKKSLVRVQSELAELGEKYGGKQRGAVVDEIRDVESKLGALNRRISDLETEFAKRGTVELVGHIMSLEEGVRANQEWFDDLAELLRYIDDAITQQRRGAAKLFNDQAARVLKEMDFEGLKVWIDESSYRLRVQRQVGSGFRDQVIASLSTSERHALAAVLTLAAKEAYAPDIPFLLVDEVLLDFDKKRLSAFVSYLKEAAIERGQLVLVSRLGGETLNIRATEAL